MIRALTICLFLASASCGEGLTELRPEDPAGEPTDAPSDASDVEDVPDTADSDAAEDSADSASDAVEDVPADSADVTSGECVPCLFHSQCDGGHCVWSDAHGGFCCQPSGPFDISDSCSVGAECESGLCVDETCAQRCVAHKLCENFCGADPETGSLHCREESCPGAAYCAQPTSSAYCAPDGTCVSQVCYGGSGSGEFGICEHDCRLRLSTPDFRECNQLKKARCAGDEYLVADTVFGAGYCVDGTLCETAADCPSEEYECLAAEDLETGAGVNTLCARAVPAAGR